MSVGDTRPSYRFIAVSTWEHGLVGIAAITRLTTVICQCFEWFFPSPFGDALSLVSFGVCNFASMGSSLHQLSCLATSVILAKKRLRRRSGSSRSWAVLAVRRTGGWRSPLWHSRPTTTVQHTRSLAGREARSTWRRWCWRTGARPCWPPPTPPCVSTSGTCSRSDRHDQLMCRLSLYLLE